MKRFQKLKHFLRVWWTEKFYGERKISVVRTHNDFATAYDVRGKHYSFSCYEYKYTLTSSKWWVSERNYYTYQVVMSDGVHKSSGVYPLMSPYYFDSAKYWHHLAIRAHIQRYIH